MRCDPGPLGHQRAVHASHGPAGVRHPAHRLGDEHRRRHPGIAGVVGSEQGAEVAEGGRAQHRVGDGVQDHVGVAVALKAGTLGHHPAPEDQRSLGVGREAVDVQPLAHPDHSMPRSSASASSRSPG